MDWTIVGNGNLEKNECGHVETGDPWPNGLSFYFTHFSSFLPSTLFTSSHYRCKHTSFDFVQPTSTSTAPKYNLRFRFKISNAVIRTSL